MGTRSRLVVVCAVLACALAAGALVMLSGPALSDDSSPSPSPSPSPTTPPPVGSVHGALTENAVSKEPILKPVVTVAGMPATVKGQSFEVAGVPVGPQPLVVSAPGHAIFKRTIVVLPGDNTVDVQLQLTVRETYLRYFAAYNSSRFYLAYRMVHPDVRRHYTYRQYASYMRIFIPYLSMRIVSIRTLPKWTPTYLHKTYHNVKLATRVLRYRCGTDICTERGVQRWHRVSGRWYCIFDWRH